MEAALQLEKGMNRYETREKVILIRFLVIDVNKSLLNLHKISDGNNDPQMCDFIEKEYLEEQVTAIKKLADMVTQLNRVGEGKLHTHTHSIVRVHVYLNMLFY